MRAAIRSPLRGAVAGKGSEGPTLKLSASAVPFSRFIGGEPMKLATKVVAGRW